MANQEVQSFVSDEERIGKLIGSLKRVEAPGDFDFRVRARIAAGRPAENRVAWLPASVRYAVALVLLLAVGGYFGLNAIYSTGEANLPVVAEVQTEIAPLPQLEPSAASTEPVVAQLIEPEPQPGIAKAKDSDKPLTPTTRRPQPTRGGGSYEIGASGETVFGPGGISNSGTVPDKTAEPRLTGPAMLASAGISTAAGGKVVAVSAGSAGQAAGVKVGDVIESVSGRTLRIKRDGVIMRIVLK